MTDSSFDQSLDRLIRDYAEGGVRPVDRYAIAEGLIAGGAPRRRFVWVPAPGRQLFSPTFVVLVIGLLLALLAAVVAGAILLRPQPNPLPGRNGAIVYSVGEIATRPYSYLHMIHADGTNDRELAQGNIPSYSKDGQTLTYFTGTGLGVGRSDLWLVQADGDGSNARPVSRVHTPFYPSPDGTLILMRDPDAGIGGPGVVREWFLLNVADGSLRLLVPAAPARLMYSDFRWSPDGSQIAFAVMKERFPSNQGSYRQAINIVDVRTGSVRRLTSRAGTDAVGLAWSPDGRYLAYAGISDGTPSPSLEGYFSPHMDIFVIAADGSGDTNLSGSAENDQDPVWAPDGTAVAYTTFRAPPDVVAMVQSVRGTEPIGEALSGPLAHFVLWSPDGRQLLTSHSGEGFGEISISDRRFTQPPLTIVDSDFTIGWAAWQRLEP